MNLRRVLVFYIRLAGFVLLIECVTSWAWSRWFWTPVQAHYMRAYVWSSVPGISPTSGLRVRWIWKIAPGGKRELAIEDDALRVPSNEQNKAGMGLSQSAREGGWTSLVEGVPERVPFARLRSVLSGQIFEGQSVWLFVLLPGLIGLVAAIFLLQCLVWLDDWQPEFPWQRQRLPWEDPAPTIFERCTVWARRISFLVVRLRRTSIQRTGKHPATPSAESRDTEVPPEPVSIELLPFGNHNGLNARVYVWSERDEID